MRTVQVLLGLTVAIAALLSVQTGVVLWRALPGAAGTLVAVYHVALGLCSHSFWPNQTGALTIGALGMGAAVTLAAGRFVRYAVRNAVAARRQVRALLQNRLALPDALAAGAARAGLRGRVDLVDSARPVAFAYGLVHGRVCLSSALIALLDAAELEAVLLHEAYHRRRRDPLLLLLTGALAHGLWFLPVLRDVRLRFDTAKEIAADAAAVQRLGRLEPLAGALYKVLAAAPASPPVTLPGLTVTQQRIDHLLSPRPGAAPAVSRRRLALSVVVLGIVSLPSVLLIASGVQPVMQSCRL